MKKRALFYFLIGMLVVSCTKRSYISEDVYYSVDFEESPATVSKPKPSVKPEKTIPATVEVPTKRNTQINDIIDFAENFIGTPYKYGGTSPSGFDCSGFIMYIFQNNNVNMPRTIDDMVKISNKVDKDNVQPGDLVFFKGRNLSSNSIGHVALVTEKTKDGFKMIHSSTSKGVIINDFEQYEYWKSRYLFAARIKEEYFQQLTQK
ncbi:MAG: C40 family peptidase [Bacteroidales bacterium]|jgi:cell wall-associated NlpC family hydrolase|nr:C40 family peptidase [Bacteroidales bacterium]